MPADNIATSGDLVYISTCGAMPKRPTLTPCTTPGCPTLTPQPGPCTTCRADTEKARGTRTQRGYGVHWQRIRTRYLDTHPRCEHPACPLPATDVDHIVPRRDGGTDDDTNLQALCHSHHSAKTVREDGGFGRRVG